MAPGLAPVARGLHSMPRGELPVPGRVPQDARPAHRSPDPLRDAAVATLENHRAARRPACGRLLFGRACESLVASVVSNSINWLEDRRDEHRLRPLFMLGNCYSLVRGARKTARWHSHSSTIRRGRLLGWNVQSGCLLPTGRRSRERYPDCDFMVSASGRNRPAVRFLRIGRIYAAGETGAVDQEKAIHFLQLAWDHGNTAAYAVLRSLGVRPQ